ncbi:MAG: acetyl-CoA carboxylase biotin carboxylase subunit, partial [Chloroflexi bacterium]
MFSRVLIANRGEIAVRIMRTCRDLGIETIAVYSDADRRALHVLEADSAVYIGASPPSESYLRVDSIVQAAVDSGAEALHPGYGLLSENPALAEA